MKGQHPQKTKLTKLIQSWGVKSNTHAPIFVTGCGVVLIEFALTRVKNCVNRLRCVCDCRCVCRLRLAKTKTGSLMLMIDRKADLLTDDTAT